MEQAEMWNNLLAYAFAAETPWTSPENDTDEYRKARPVEFSNLGAPCWVGVPCALLYRDPSDSNPRQSEPPKLRRLSSLRLPGTVERKRQFMDAYV
eukprot:6173412-Pleurochrysis_carterae.AAC.2